MPKLDDIKKLPPSERIRKLHELEKNNKEEIEQAHRLLKQSQAEEKRAAEIDEMLQEVVVPEPKQVKPEDLWKKEESLEDRARKETPNLSKEETKQYGIDLTAQSIDSLHKEADDIYKTVKQQGEISYGQMKRAEQIYEAAKEKEQAYHKSGSENLEYESNTTAQMMEKTMAFKSNYRPI